MLTTAGADFSTTNEEITFTPTESRECAQVGIVSDNTLEQSEIFTVTLSSLDENAVVTTAIATVTILDTSGMYGNGH